MENPNQLAIVQGNGQLVNFASAPTCKDYVAGKLGITLPKSTKENPVTMKTVKELAVKAGKTESEVKALVKQFDGLRSEHYAQSAVIAGMLASDTRFRKSVKSSVNKKGEVIGYNITARRETSKAMSKDAEIAALKATVAALLAKSAA
jgi:hypothetical protein